MNRLKKIFVIAALASAAFAGSEANAQSRAKNKLGVGIGFLGDPAPSLLGYQLRYNLSPRFQVMGSYGKISASGSSTDPNTGLVTAGGGSVTSFGVNARAFLIPSWSLSPFIGAGFSRSNINGSFSLSGETINSAEKNLNVITASAGIDHQAFIGFNIGVGVNYFIGPKIVKDALTMLPYFHAAWFF